MMRAAMAGVGAALLLLGGAGAVPTAGNSTWRAPPTAESLAKNTPGCGSSAPISGWHTLSVPDPLAGLTNRRFRLYVPFWYDEFAQTPIVFDYHGYSNRAERHEDESGIRDMADEQTFIAVFPEGLDDTERANQQAYSWNSVGTVASPGPLGDTCMYADSWAGYSCHSSCRPTRGCYSNLYAAGCDCSTCADDVLFTELMLNWLEDRLCIDQRRVHVTGFSNGGMMAYQLAQSRLGNRIASIAPLSSAPLLGFDQPPIRPMALMTIQGTNDRIIPANCSGSNCGPHNSTTSSDGFYYSSVDSVISTWGSSNDCVGGLQQFPTRYDGDGDFSCITPGTCRAGGPVVRCSFEGGHTWPFSNTVQWARLIYEFFNNNPLLLEGETKVPEK